MKRLQTGREERAYQYGTLRDDRRIATIEEHKGTYPNKRVESEQSGTERTGKHNINTLYL